jgi:alpha-D-ribose 1-methylphosphonate 5-triphosphate diphosphatase
MMFARFGMLVIKGSDVLLESGFEHCDIGVSRAQTGAGVHLDPPAGSARTVLDAAGLLALPGAIDIHGDAFERQIMPRPNVRFDMNIALRDTDRQLAANGVTTAFHGLTWSWEPGFRGAESARIFVGAVESVRPHCLVDHRIHLRQETFNLDAEDEIITWLQHGKIDMLAFNDHLTGTIKVRHRPEKIGDMMRRTGLSEEAFLALVDQCASREHEVAGSIRRLTIAAKAADVPTLSHDDLDIESRTRLREIGIGIAEFPVTNEVAQAASLAGDEIVFGAPNVLRGGSHTNCPSAAEMVRAGWCTILASDYYYPALAQAPFVLEAQSGIPLATGWGLVSANPARAAGLGDRGTIANGARGDIVLMRRNGAGSAEVVATICDGEIVFLSDYRLLKSA